MATRRRKPGRPKGSKNKKRSKTSVRKKASSGRRKKRATPAQLRALKKARKVRAQNLGKTTKKTSKKKMTKKRREQLKLNLMKARAAREMKRMPATRRMHASDLLKPNYDDAYIDTVRASSLRHPHPSSMPSILLRVRRRPAASQTLVSR